MVIPTVIEPLSLVEVDNVKKTCFSKDNICIWGKGHWFYCNGYNYNDATVGT